MTKISAILLAAGLSERMGGPNKMLLDIGDFKLVQLTYANLQASDADRLIVVTGRDSGEVTALFPNDQEVVFNSVYQQGMTSSIQAGVTEAADADAYMICLGDMIWLKKAHYNALIDKAKEALIINPQAIVMPLVNGRPGNPVIFSRQYRAAILNHRQANGCKGIVQQNRQHLVYLETDDQAYLNDIDTPEDFDALNA